MIDLSTVSNFAFENLEQVTVLNNGTYFHARCPVCGDSKTNQYKKRFNLDYNNGNPGWHCFNCNGSGSFISLYCYVLGISPEVAKKQLFNFQSIKSRLTKTPKTPKIIPTKENFNWILKDCGGEDLVVDSIQYEIWVKHLKTFRKERLIPDSIKLYYAYKGKYKGRIIIPIMEGDDIIYFQGRRMPGSSMNPKYKNPVAEKSLIIHNEKNFNREKFIIVTEGLIDCAMVGNQGTAMLGVEAANNFIKKLRKLTNKKVIIAYDNDDAGIHAMKKFMAENKYRHLVDYFLMPNEYQDAKDINILRVEYRIGDLYNFVVENRISYGDYIIQLGRV